jgi:TPR repeat protein
MIGYCYHKGIGVKSNPARSVEYYRRAYQRGSLAAYNALREIYDEIRPDDPEFRIPE